MFFSASYDSTTKVVSCLICALAIFAIVVSRSPIAAGIGGAVIFLAYAYSPRGYTVQDGSILVKRLFGDARLALEDVREARVAAGDLQGAIRLFGNGGVFGYYGLFQTTKLGKSTWYVTNRAHAVVVITGAKTAVFSPDDVEGFLMAIRARVPVPISPPGEPVPRGRVWTATVIGAAVGVAALGVALFAVLYSPGPPGYTLTPQTLTIHDRFYPVTLDAAKVDVDHIRVIDFGTDPGWRPTQRTNGFGNGNYISGQFRVASGRIVRMYRAHGLRLVLLPAKGDGTAVLLETRDPDKFVEEVRQEWSGS